MSWLNEWTGNTNTCNITRSTIIFNQIYGGRPYEEDDLMARNTNAPASNTSLVFCKIQSLFLIFGYTLSCSKVLFQHILRWMIIIWRIWIILIIVARKGTVTFVCSFFCTYKCCCIWFCFHSWWCTDGIWWATCSQ